MDFSISPELEALRLKVQEFISDEVLPLEDKPDSYNEYENIKPAIEITEEEWRSVLAVNLDAVWYVAQEAARRMIAADKPGTIINTASILGFLVGKGMASYAVAKAGVVSATKSLALELARNDIRVNAIAPGYVLTEINRSFLRSARVSIMPPGSEPEPGAGSVMTKAERTSPSMIG